jgi:hypothetical protein
MQFSSHRRTDFAFGDAQRNYIHKRNEMLACHDADVRAQSRFAVHFEGAK